MYFVYIDDSGDESVCCYAALVIHESSWRDVQKLIREHRRKLKQSDGMLVTKELHATEFVAGRVRVGPQMVAKGRRCQIFRETLDLIASFPNTHLLNAIGPRASERLLF